MGAAGQPRLEVVSPEIGIIGGSGFYELFSDAEGQDISTPWGQPSAPVSIGSLGGREVAFLPRHGEHHQFPPHAINYRANLWALREAGVRWVLAPCSSGSLRSDIAPGDFVICDQYIDRTSGRQDTYYDGPEVVHVSAAEPYSPVLRDLLVAGCRSIGVPARETGTLIVIQGPRFSTRAESEWYGQMGGHVVNMTAYPEGHLARELELCYATIALVTDYDAGVHGGQPVTAGDVVRVFAENNSRMRELLEWVVPRIPDEPDPSCASALAGAGL